MRANRDARGDPEPVAVREGGELEEAVRAWEDDQAWERAQVGVGKGKGVVGSRMRTTGQVEQKVRGWGWS